MKRIELTKGMYSIVDDDLFDILNQFSWYAQKSSTGVWYAARRNSEGKIVLMHQFVLERPNGMEIDHINNDGLKNTRDNPRICTHAQNLANIKKKVGHSSVYKGVSWNNEKLKWDAYIKHNYKKINLGRYTDETEAAMAYNEKAKELFGVFANINLINGSNGE